jgi:hypothetical protein
VIDPELAMVWFVGSALTALLMIILLFVSDTNWHWWAVQLRRARRYWLVTYQRRTTPEERRAVVYVGRFVWAWLLMYTALKGW